MAVAIDVEGCDEAQFDRRAGWTRRSRVALAAGLAALLSARGAYAANDGRDLDLLAHLAAARVVRATSRIDFGTVEARRSRALRSGWLLDENDGRSTFVWATGNQAIVRFFRLSPDPLQIRYRAYGPPASVSLTVSVNGQEVAKREVPPGWHDESIVVPAGIARVGENLLELGFSGTFHESWGQQRDLALAIDAMEFGPGGPESPPPAAEAATALRGHDGRLRLPPQTGVAWTLRGGARASVRLHVPASSSGPAIPLAIFSTPLRGGPSVPIEPKPSKELPGLFEADLPEREGRAQRLLFANAGTDAMVIHSAILRRATSPVSSSSGSPSILMVVLDALRADHVHSLGYPRETTPCIDRLAEGAVSFTNAFAQGSMTIVSMASVLTGTLASEHGARPETRLDPELPTIAESLRAQGYRTALVTANPFLGETFGLTRGFDSVYELFDTVPGFERGPDGVVRARSVTREVIDLLLVDDPAPFFLLAHYLQPHAPYAPPSSRWGRCGAPGAKFDGRQDVLTQAIDEGREAARAIRQDAIDCYDDNLLYVDGQICRLIDQISLLGMEDDTVVVVTSDHGEEFLDHGTFGHPREHLYDESIHVPLFLRIPGAAAGRVSSLVALVDLSATFLELGGVKDRLGGGKSLLPLVRTARSGPERGSVVSFGPVGRKPDGGWRTAIRTRRHKLIRGRDGRTEMVFDLEADARERQDLAPAPPPEASRLEFELEEIVGSEGIVAEAAVVGERTRRQLEALGYMDPVSGE